MLFAYMAGGGLEVLKCFVRGGHLLCVCVCGGGQVQYLSFREKTTDPPPINKRLIPITKSPKGHYVAYLFFRYFLLCTYYSLVNVVYLPCILSFKAIGIYYTVLTIYGYGGHIGYVT